MAAGSLQLNKPKLFDKTSQRHNLFNFAVDYGLNSLRSRMRERTESSKGSW